MLILVTNMEFYVGLHNPHHAHHFERAFISINRIRNRRSSFPARGWVMDSGAFTEVSTYGTYRETPDKYADEINRWKDNGNMQAAVTQDYMCEPFILAKTGLSIMEHQKRTIDRYTTLVGLTDAYVMPVLQGYDPLDYQEHLDLYGGLLGEGAWVGVGSICKRNNRVDSIAAVLSSIKILRPDLRLHGFGLKTTALESPYIRSLLHSADSMAWSFAARREGRDANSWQEAKRFEARIGSENRSSRA